WSEVFHNGIVCRENDLDSQIRDQFREGAVEVRILNPRESAEVAIEAEAAVVVLARRAEQGDLLRKLERLMDLAGTLRTAREHENAEALACRALASRRGRFFFDGFNRHRSVPSSYFWFFA